MKAMEQIKLADVKKMVKSLNSSGAITDDISLDAEKKQLVKEFTDAVETCDIAELSKFLSERSINDTELYEVVSC